jgi:hypothetical protein
MSTPGYLSSGDILLNAKALFRAEQSRDLRSLIADKIDDLRHYDVQAMERVAAILCWGRSGSVLLASHLDGHDDVIMLPALRSDGIYRFFELYRSLSLYQKLIAYAAFTELYDPQSEQAGCGRSFFDGAFAISSAHYYAATQAICEEYSKWPSEVLTSRRTFFLMVHIAYTLALGRRPASSHPIIVCAQHEWSNVRAKQFVEDFPQAKFIHTVRDPISSFDRTFAWYFDADLLPSRQPLGCQSQAVAHGVLPARRISTIAPWTTIRALIDADLPHSGMESQTRAIRFEDLHCNTAATMLDLSDWLGIPCQATLLESTFNGIPYVVTRDGKTWSGRRPEKAQRYLQNTSLKDRALLFALFHENFLAWNYPCPKIFDSPTVRFLVLVLFPLLPMKTEIIVARAILKRVLPLALRRGDVAILMNSLLRIVFCRLAIIWRLLSTFSKRRRSILQTFGADTKSEDQFRKASGGRLATRGQRR